MFPGQTRTPDLDRSKVAETEDPNLHKTASHVSRYAENLLPVSGLGVRVQRDLIVSAVLSNSSYSATISCRE